MKGNVTFHENVKIYEHDYKYTEFKNVLVKIKEEGLIITYKDNGQLVDYCYDYSKLWRIESSDKVIFKLTDDVFLNPRFKTVHAMPGDNYYVADTEQNYNENSFEILPVKNESVADELVEFLNDREDKINVLTGFYNLFIKEDGGYNIIEY